MYTAYAWKLAQDTPLMRKQVHRLCVEISQDSHRNVDISGELTATVPPGLRWSCRRQGRYSQCEKPAPAIADGTNKVCACEIRDAALNQNLYPKRLNRAKEIFLFFACQLAGE